MPALPLDEAGKYVAGAYAVFVVLILVYVAIMAAKLQRIERELASFAEQRKNGGSNRAPEPIRDEAAPGRESETATVSVSSRPSGSGGGDVI